MGTLVFRATSYPPRIGSLGEVARVEPPARHGAAGKTTTAKPARNTRTEKHPVSTRTHPKPPRPRGEGAHAFPVVRPKHMWAA